MQADHLDQGFVLLSVCPSELFLWKGVALLKVLRMACVRQAFLRLPYKNGQLKNCCEWHVMQAFLISSLQSDL